MELELRNVTVSYSAAEKILDNLNLEVNKGLFLGITGKSGSGKTTLLETICGFHKPDMGQVLFNNQNIYESEFDTLSFRKKVQMVFQFPENQFFETEIRREVEFGIKNSCLSSEEIIRRVTETLQTVGLYDEGIDELIDKYGDEVTLKATADEGSYFAGWNCIPHMPGNWLKNEYYEYASSPPFFSENSANKGFSQR